MNTFDVALRTGTLPENPLELAKMKYFGESALQFLRSNLAKANELEIPMEQRKTMLAEGQKIGIAMLETEAKIGEISKTIPRERGNQYGAPIEEGSSISKHEKLGLKNRRDLDNAQAINNHPEAVQKIIKQAAENEDIPTKTAVLNEIRYKNEKARQENIKGNLSKSKLEMKLEEQQYLLTLEGIISRLPKTPPKDWSDIFFNLARGYANIIEKRLEAFHG